MKAVVSAPVCPLWTGPDRDRPLADEALSGMALEVLETPAPGWARVRTEYRYEGYAPLDCLVLGERAETWAARPKKTVRWKTAADVLARPSFQAPRLLTLPLGAAVAAAEEGDGWQAVALADGTAGYVRAGALAGPPEPPEGLPEKVLRRRLVEAALAYRGSQYRWGGKTPLGLDCSGLVFMAYWLNGVTVYRDARLAPGFALVEIDPGERKPGDALFFPGHAALYLGGGRYLHATGRAGGDGVAVNSLDPRAPDYRADLARSLTQVGSYVGFHR